MIGEKQLFFTNTKPRSPYVAHTLPESKDCASVALAVVSSEAPSAARSTGTAWHYSPAEVMKAPFVHEAGKEQQAQLSLHLAESEASSRRLSAAANT